MVNSGQRPLSCPALGVEAEMKKVKLNFFKNQIRRREAKAILGGKEWRESIFGEAMIERATVGLEQITQTRIEPWPQLRW